MYGIGATIDIVVNSMNFQEIDTLHFCLYKKNQKKLSSEACNFWKALFRSSVYGKNGTLKIWLLHRY